MKSEEKTNLHLLRDLTDKLNTRDAALVASEKKFKGFFDNASAGMCIFNINTERFIEVNKTLCDWTGYSKEEMLTHPVSHFIAKENQKTSEFLEKQRDLLAKSGKTLEVHEFINEYKHKDTGKSIWLKWNATAPDKDGINYNVCNNITKEIELRNEIHSNRLIYENIIRNSNELLKLYKMVDGLPELVYVSESVFEYTGYHVKEHMHYEIEELIHPDDAEQAMKDMLLILTTKKKTTIRYRGKHREKGFTWAESVLTPILDYHGDVEYILLSSRIIQHYKDREHQLMKAVGLFNQGEQLTEIGTYEVLLTGEQEYIHVSSTFMELFDIPEGTDSNKIEKYIKNRMDEKTIKKVVREWNKTIATPGQKFDFIYWITNLNGIKRLFRGRGIVNRNEDGTPASMVGTVQDITEQEKMFNKVTRKQEK